MQNNVRKYSSDEINDGKGSKLDIPTHGRLPRWLEDMASMVERRHSLVLERNYEESNKDRYFSPSLDSIAHKRDNTPSTSAKYGRRSAASSQCSSTNKQFLTLDMDTYIVPKMEELNLKTISKSQFEPFNYSPIYKNLPQLKRKPDCVCEMGEQSQSYSPSLLEQNLGRRSRLDSVSDHITTSLKSLPAISNQSDYKKLQLDYSEPNLHHSKIFDSYLNDSQSCLEVDRKLKFDQEFIIAKNKIEKHMKNKDSKPEIAIGRTSESKSDKFLLPFDDPQNFNENHYKPDDLFIIPELPSGLIMIVDILTTWGDKFYVGLNGIEIFDIEGNVVPVKKISACPEDINVLPECTGDPRVVTNLLDGINRTQDDNHLWLTPFEAGQHHLITIEFYKKTQLAMIRIWNYNKSRIHSYRGAKDVVITLDGSFIFKGEIAQACGSILGGIESFGDTILFTTEEEILEKISVNDISFTTLIATENKEILEKVERPSTATANEPIERPYTHAFNQRNHLEPNDELFGIHRIDIILMLNWGRSDYIGLTGLEVIGDSDISLTISQDNLRTNHLTSNAMLSRLIDDENITTDRKHMWYTQYTPGEEIIISVVFDQVTYIAGIRIWNYNENMEMSFCGVRIVKIFLDNKPLFNQLTNDNTFLIRRAPGNTHYDYVQEIQFSRQSFVELQPEPIYDLNSEPETKNKMEESFDDMVMPEGFVIQIVIYTTWGDQYYVGLNGIEIYDQNGKKIILTEANICAHPESVNVLPGVSGDIRTPDKLIDGINERSDGTHSWLVPVIPKCLNRIYIVFDQPVTVSVIKLWNYLKTPTRGVKEFGILFDDLLVYNGILDKITDKPSVKYRTILFTNDKKVLQKEMASLVKHSIDSQATVLTDEEPRMTTGGSLPNADQSLRPFTSVNYANRGKTSQSH